ncbi:MAG: DUF4124 domain-containing protein [Zoogloeaceae bacterium]|nr:DUF4124 domain-containing protein [Zoogloeaceae bacterium]
MRCLAGMAVVLGLFAQSAAADIFKCVDDQGRVTYTNSRTSKGCSTLSRDLPVSSVPAPSSSSRSAPSTDGGAFPKVSEDTQRSRDSDRKQILNQELAAEERSLEAAKKALAEQEAVRYGDERNYQKVLDRLQPFKDKVELHQRNVDALKREIGALR